MKLTKTKLKRIIKEELEEVENTIQEKGTGAQGEVRERAHVLNDILTELQRIRVILER